MALRNLDAIEAMKKSLLDNSLPVAQRFRVIFTLRNIGGKEAIEALTAGLIDDSALLKHEICFALGQMQDSYAIPFLEKTLSNISEDSMVRHEAGEALGAIAMPSSLAILEEFAKDNVVEVAETCQLASDRIKFFLTKTKKKEENGSHYDSVDPAPPINEKNIKKLREILLDTSIPLFERYGAMFALRNIGGNEAVDALAEALNDNSALVRHEIAYVLGQMQDSHAVNALKKKFREICGTSYGKA